MIAARMISAEAVVGPRVNLAVNHSIIFGTKLVGARGGAAIQRESAD